ncbi:hypothetical protein QEO94_08535 [Kingella negevensis]|uniref:hypothetical protein n=1 Tax=Kingella negevensis TaxID=1522312 RepID=UPI002543893E|nr:hypothetical protein [Kingella negevensis]WII92675.1 hypothetical protein QEO94_08535 [Kingella negevensis]
MDKNFITLNNEGCFARNILGLGITELSKANYANLGIYWQAFTNLSVGLERLAKLVVLLDYALRNNGLFPDFQELKKYGHDLIKLYEYSQEIMQFHCIEMKFADNLETDIHQNILDVLNNFSKSDRYANINFLTNSKQINNPVTDWALNVDDWIWNNKISPSKQEKILRQAEEMDYLAIYALYISELDELITDAYDASILTGKWQLVVPYRRLYVVQIIRYWTEIFLALTDKCHADGISVPFFNEVYAPLFLANDSYIKKRKSWLKHY